MKKKAKKNQPQIKLKDIIQRVVWDDVALELVWIYPSVRPQLHKYNDVFEHLLKMVPKETGEQVVIEPINYRIDECCPYYMVFGRKDFVDEGETMAYEPWSDWLGRYLVQEPCEVLTYPKICAICLYEMTIFGFTEDEICKRKIEDQKEWEELKQKHKTEDESYLFDFPEITMKDKLRRLEKWLRWENVAKKYYGQDEKWFVENFTCSEAPDYYDILDWKTLKAAIREIARDLVWIADDL